jgi:hypothetical protein
MGVSPLVSQAPPTFQSRSPGLRQFPSRPMAADDREVAYQKLAEEKERLSGQVHSLETPLHLPLAYSRSR